MPVEEWQRKTEQLKLRLPKDQAKRLRMRAAEEEVTPQEYLLRLLRRDLQIV